MRTTVDLPDPIFRKLKIRASVSGTSLKELLTRYVERGLREPALAENRSCRTPLPVIIPHGGPPIRALTNADLHRIEEEEDIERLKRTGWVPPERD